MSRPATLDPAALMKARHHLAAVDPVMAHLVAAVGPHPMQVHRGGSAFAYLARAILAQQISVAAARSIAGRLTARFGWPWRPEHVLGATEAELRTLGLSRQKAAYLRDLAARTRDGLPLGRPDVLPVDDLGIQAAMRRAYRMRSRPKRERMRRIAEAWRPYRTVACWYLWRSLELPPPLD